jgi:hypothetical protein
MLLHHYNNEIKRDTLLEITWLCAGNNSSYNSDDFEPRAHDSTNRVGETPHQEKSRKTIQRAESSLSGTEKGFGRILVRNSQTVCDHIRFYAVICRLLINL